MVLVFTPDLTANEQQQLDRLARLARSGLNVNQAQWSSLQAVLPEIRAFRTRTMAQWNALTAAQREADEIQYLNDLTDVLRALLRDS